MSKSINNKLSSWLFSTFLKTLGVFVSTVLGDVDSIGLEPHHPVSTRTNQSGHKRPMHFRESPAAYAHDTSGRSTKEEEHDIAEVHKAHVKNRQPNAVATFNHTTNTASIWIFDQNTCHRL